MMLPRWLAFAAAVLIFLPSGASGLAALLWLGASLLGLVSGHWKIRQEGLKWLLAWALWMLASAAWTVTPLAEWPRHASHVAILVSVPVMAASIAPADAARALRGFVVAAAALGLLWALHAWSPLPEGRLLSSLVHYTGNKGIVNGVLVALAAALALHLGALTRGRLRAAWWLLAVLLAAAVLWKSASRTAHGIVMLLPLAWLWWRVGQGGGGRGRRVVAMSAAAAVVVGGLWWFGAVDGRTEGLGGAGGLAARDAAGHLAQSDASRRSLYAATLAMIEARPLAGHGLGAWATRWREAVDRGEAPTSMRAFNTAHSAALQLAAEGGAVAVFLLLGVVAAWLGFARRAAAPGLGGDGAPLVLVLLAFGLAGLVNAVLRDAVFSSPMVVLLALALAVARPAPDAVAPPAGTTPPPH